MKHFPALFVLLNSLSGPLLGTDTAFFLSWLGFLTAWIYLRFYRLAPSLATASTSTASEGGYGYGGYGDGSVIRGDASDTFAFAHFFPDAVQLVLAPLADRVYDILVSLKICTPFSSADVEAGNEQASARAEGGLPSLMDPSGRGRGAGQGRREEAERRRALALRALDQRLNASRAVSTPVAGAVGDGGEGGVKADEAAEKLEA